jgi:hypothetical protein
MNLQQILGVASKSLNEVLGLPSKLESLLGVNTGFMKPGLNQAVKGVAEAAKPETGQGSFMVDNLYRQAGVDKQSVVPKDRLETAGLIAQNAIPNNIAPAIAERGVVVLGNINKNLDRLYELAPGAKSEIDQLAQQVANKHLAILATAPLKGRERALAKVLLELGKKTKKLSDIARNTIVAEAEDIGKIIDELRGNPFIDIKHIKPGEDKLGYSGFNIKVKTEAGLPSEIQVNTPEMIFAKEPAEIAKKILGLEKYNELVQKFGKGGLGHWYYEQYRNINGFFNQTKKKLIEEVSSRYYKPFSGK